MIDKHPSGLNCLLEGLIVDEKLLMIRPDFLQFIPIKSKLFAIIKNSLELDPRNENARAKLKKLEEEK